MRKSAMRFPARIPISPFRMDHIVIERKENPTAREI
jgi:hypothetical protein